MHMRVGIIGILGNPDEYRWLFTSLVVTYRGKEDIIEKDG